MKTIQMALSLLYSIYSKNLYHKNIIFMFTSRSQCEKYSQRSDSRSVQCYFGSPTARYERENDTPLIVKNYNKEIFNADAKYMYEIMGKKAKCINNMTEWLGHTILEKHGLNLTEGTLRSQLGDMTTFGRIVSDSDGKINAQSVLLEGTIETNSGYTVTLNLNKVPKCSLFPGQVAVVQGNNPNCTTFIADKILTDTVLPLPEECPVLND
ncbi:hypothetical protein NQ317_003625 [Molorchus minor]|uniref:DNA polymerase alpha subunit B OB domain-containing protein n=1 Tax=Molorchus minor TaxID=1323400 RepID=A0ABQ9JJQ5_9CUCU|nr:hypothetical protein NQ317_003625 [Molorchus minor]